MEKIIKCRGLTPDGQLVYGFAFIWKNIKRIVTDGKYIESVVRIDNLKFDIVVTDQGDFEEFTNCYDTCLKEIYVGDICKVSSDLFLADYNFTGIVVFDAGAFWVENNELQRRVLVWSDSYEVKVIGNIHSGIMIIGNL